MTPLFPERVFARSCRGRGPALGAPLPARLRQSGLGCTSLECSQDSCGERLRPGPGLFLAALTAGPGRRLAVPQRLAFSVQSLVEPSVSAFRYMVRSCPRIKMGGGWEGAIWKRRRILSSFGPALHTPLSPLSYLGLWVIFATLCSKHAWACRGVEDTCPSPSVINGYAFLRLQVEACFGNLLRAGPPVWPHWWDRGPCSGNLRLNEPGLRPVQGRLWDVQSSCADPCPLSIIPRTRSYLYVHSFFQYLLVQLFSSCLGLHSPQKQTLGETRMVL